MCKINNLISKISDRTFKIPQRNIYLKKRKNVEKEIMKLRFGLNGEEPLTIKEISFKLGNKVSDVDFIEINAIKKT